MLINEMVTLFLDSRKRGTTGAKKKSSPKTLDIYSANLRMFEQWLLSEPKEGAITRYEGVKRMHIMHFVDWLEAKESSGEWAKASVLQVLRSLRTFFRWVDLDEDCQLEQHKGLHKYLPAIPKNPRRTDIPQLKEVKTFKNSFNTNDTWEYRDYVACCLMLETGIRVTEACNIKVNDILWDQRVVVVNGKTGPRPISLTKGILVLLKGWLKRRSSCRYAKESGYLFVSKRGPQMCADAFCKSYRKHRIKHSLPRITSHSFRHLFATNFLRKGGDIEKCRLMTGHTTYESLKEYLHLSKIASESMQEAVEKASLLKDL